MLRYIFRKTKIKIIVCKNVEYTEEEEVTILKQINDLRMDVDCNNQGDGNCNVIAHYLIRVRISYNNYKDALFHPEGYDSMQTRDAPQYNIIEPEDQQQQIYQSYQHQSTFMTFGHLFY
ncbi:Integrase H2C2 domain-containing protein [Aphis craccivora]|uniref:Integrase H2C2 domain-containing protein n=1 Tax=Aphis craccivora TaxID=307492 RepID=A0A6G0Y169_APHCR|nr:Integrase H2C2 domain-containing protein [Aphis craccivora]